MEQCLFCFYNVFKFRKSDMFHFCISLHKKMKLSIKDLFSKYDQISRKLKKSWRNQIYWRNPQWKTSFYVQWFLLAGIAIFAKVCCSIDNWTCINQLLEKKWSLKMLLRNFQYFHFSNFNITFAKSLINKLLCFFSISLHKNSEYSSHHFELAMHLY